MELGTSPSVLALAWLLHQDGVSSAIVGPADRQQFETALQAVALHLDGTTLDRLDALFPPCGTAPEAYAW